MSGQIIAERVPRKFLSERRLWCLCSQYAEDLSLSFPCCRRNPCFCSFFGHISAPSNYSRKRQECGPPYAQGGGKPGGQHSNSIRDHGWFPPHVLVRGPPDLHRNGRGWYSPARIPFLQEETPSAPGTCPGPRQQIHHFRRRPRRRKSKFVKHSSNIFFSHIILFFISSKYGSS